MIHSSRYIFVTFVAFNIFCFPHCRDLRAAEVQPVNAGDTVGIQFTCRFPNGEIAASTSSAVAADKSLKKASVFLPRSKDDPIEVVAGKGGHTDVKNFPVPFEDEIVNRIAGVLPGMKPGESKTIEIRSERPTGVPDKDQVIQMALVRQRPKELRMTRDEYKSRVKKDPKEGDEFVLDPIIPGKVASISENEVVIRFSAQPGSAVETPFGKGTIRENGNNYEIVIEAVKGKLVRTGPIVGRISDVQERMFTIDYGDAFGGEPLSCEVKAENVSTEKLSQKGK